MLIFICILNLNVIYDHIVTLKAFYIKFLQVKFINIVYIEQI